MTRHSPTDEVAPILPPYIGGFTLISQLSRASRRVEKITVVHGSLPGDDTRSPAMRYTILYPSQCRRLSCKIPRCLPSIWKINLPSSCHGAIWVSGRSLVRRGRCTRDFFAGTLLLHAVRILFRENVRPPLGEVLSRCSPSVVICAG